MLEKKYAEAEKETTQGLAAAKNKLGPEHPNTKELQQLLTKLQSLPK
jgi:hypothetical protein